MSEQAECKGGLNGSSWRVEPDGGPAAPCVRLSVWPEVDTDIYLSPEQAEELIRDIRDCLARLRDGAPAR